MSLAELEERQELLPHPPGSPLLVSWAPLAVSVASVMVEVGSYGPAWLPSPARALCLFGGMAGFAATLVGWRRSAARLYREAGLVCAQCDRPLPLDPQGRKVLLTSGICPRCGFRTVSDPPVPGTELRLPPMTALGER